MAGITGTEGFRSVSVDLGKAAASSQTKAQLVLRKSMYDVRRGGKLRAPVDTGNLRGSITGETKGLTAEVGPTANYGRYVEDGTSRMAPQPYMGPALDAVEPGFVMAMQQIADETL